jgi:hypothetical protein
MIDNLLLSISRQRTNSTDEYGQLTVELAESRSYRPGETIHGKSL